MTFEYKGAHPRAPSARGNRRRGKKPSPPEETMEETPIVAELRVAVAKEDVETPDDEETSAR